MCCSGKGRILSKFGLAPFLGLSLSEPILRPLESYKQHQKSRQSIFFAYVLLGRIQLKFHVRILMLGGIND